MPHQELEDAVCAAIGEDLREIRRRGFSMVDPAEVDFDPEPENTPAQVLDWDDYWFDQPLPSALRVHSLHLRRSA